MGSMGGIHIVEAVRQNYVQGERILCSIQGNASISRRILSRKRATTVKRGIPSLVISSRSVLRRMADVQVTANEETISGGCEPKNIISEISTEVLKNPHYKKDSSLCGKSWRTNIGTLPFGRSVLSSR
jgi:hypothetical protein